MQSVAILAQDCRPVLPPLPLPSFVKVAACLSSQKYMEPTPAEVSAFKCIGDVLDWAGFAEVNADKKEDPSARCSLLELLGLKPAEFVRVVGHVP